MNLLARCQTPRPAESPGVSGRTDAARVIITIHPRALCRLLRRALRRVFAREQQIQDRSRRLLLVGESEFAVVQRALEDVAVGPHALIAGDQDADPGLEHLEAMLSPSRRR